MTDRETTSPWLQPIVDRVNAHHSQGGFIISLAEYRPDLARNVAHVLELRFFDYRGELMSRLGWEAHTLTLSDLDQTLQTLSTEGGLVAFNVEALLGTKPETERTQWLIKFLDKRFVHPVVLPLCIFGDESMMSNPRYYAVSSESIPDQSFLNRLAM